MNADLDEIRYPLGRFEPDPDPTVTDVADWIVQLSALPENLRAAIDGLGEGRVSMYEALQLYAWHGRHHAAQIRGLRTRSGW